MVVRMAMHFLTEIHLIGCNGIRSQVFKKGDVLFCNLGDKVMRIIILRMLFLLSMILIILIEVGLIIILKMFLLLYIVLFMLIVFLFYHFAKRFIFLAILIDLE